MKVNSFREIFRFSSPLKAQSEGEGYGSSPGGSESEGRKGRNPDPGADTEGLAARRALSAEQELAAVQAALADFETEARTQNHGLQAALANPQPGPGLTVVLSDINGSVIRTFSSSEFLRLRTNGRQDSRGRGKLLDQKL